MYVDFNVAETPLASGSVALKSIYRVQADASYRVRHRPLPHGEHILICVTAGEGELVSKGKGFTLKAGTALFISPCDGEFTYKTAKDKWSFWWFEFFGGDGFFAEGAVCPVHISPFVAELCERCLYLQKQSRLLEASHMLGGLLAELGGQLALGTRADGDSIMFRKAQLFISENLSSVTVAGLAKEVGMGERSLRGLFHAQAGCSPKEYILSEKFSNACYMLKNTSKTIGEISELLGFSSQFHFSKGYSAHFGLTPRAYRDKVYWDSAL